MASRRNLVSRTHLNESSPSSSAQLSQRNSHPTNTYPTPLPPYEPPSCPLTASGRRALDELRINHNYIKYQNHIAESKKLLPIVVGDSNERFYVRREKVARAAEKRQRQGRGDDEKTEHEIEDETFTTQYGRKVDELTTKAEKAMRDLIDYSDELAMQDALLKDVIESIAAAPASARISQRISSQRRLGNNSSDEDEEVESLADPVEVPSAVELLKNARENYTAAYMSKTMLERYDNT